MLVTESRRKTRAYAELQNSEPPDHAFTGTRFDKARSEIHSRSEATLHRWDIEGDDDVSRRLLAQPDLLANAVWALDTLPVLTESAQCPRRPSGSVGTHRDRVPHARRARRRPHPRPGRLPVLPHRAGDRPRTRADPAGPPPPAGAVGSAPGRDGTRHRGRPRAAGGPGTHHVARRHALALTHRSARGRPGRLVSLRAERASVTWCGCASTCSRPDVRSGPLGELWRIRQSVGSLKQDGSASSSVDIGRY